MMTETVIADEGEDTRDAVRRAVALLRAGQVVALPTETVYGLGADAFNPEAVARIYEAKDRPSFDPLIVHVAGKDKVEEVAVLEPGIAKVARRLIEVFWPGPLTLVLPRNPALPEIVTSGLPTVGVRMSANPVFAKIVKELGSPIAAPSANRFGRISPTSAAAVLSELDGRIPLIVDAGACSEGLESTIVKLEPASASGPAGKKAPKPLLTILRAGPITKENLQIYGKVVRGQRLSPATGQIEAPGQLDSHYAPRTPLRLVMDPKSFVPEPGKTYGLLSYRGKRKDGYLDMADFAKVAVLSPGSGKLYEAGLRLFFLMRELDESGLDEILAEPVSDKGLGVAINDRLRRASSF
jgi:L-threonylcarbamoyladenylate synthase